MKLYTYSLLRIEAVVLELNMLQIISLTCIGVVLLAAFVLSVFNTGKVIKPLLLKIMKRLGNFIGLTNPGMDPEDVFMSFEEKIKEAGFEYDPEQDYFFSSLYPWQRKYGYTRLYDVVAPPMSMIIDSEPIRFEYGGYKWLIELWKGQYGMTTGCEIGVYCTKKFIPKEDVKEQVDRNIDDEKRWDRLLDLATPVVKGDLNNKKEKLNIIKMIDYDELLGYNTTFYYSVNDDSLLNLSFVARKNGKILISARGRHWWLTGFKLGEFSEPSQIKMSVSISFTDSIMKDAFLSALYKLGYKTNEVYVRNNTVQFVFDKPYSKQPYTRSAITDKITQSRNRLLCENYQELTAGAKSMSEKVSIVQQKNPELYKQIFQMGKSKKLFTGKIEN